MSNATRCALLNEWLEQARLAPGGQGMSSLTISNGRIAPTRHAHVVDTQGGAATDDLDFLTRGSLPNGTLVWLRIQDTARKVTARHGQGTTDQLVLNTLLMPLTGTAAWLLVRLEPDGWHEVDRSYPFGSSLWREHAGVAESATYPVATEAEALAGAATNRLTTPQRVAQMLAGAALLLTGRAALPAGPVLATDLLLVSRGGTLFKATGSQIAPEVKESGEFVLTASTANSFAHDLGAAPGRVAYALVCKTAEHGYAVNRRIWNADPAKIQVWSNTTDVGYARSDETISIVPAAGGNRQTINNANWRLVLRASLS